MRDRASGAERGRSETAQATVYQKHRTLPSRKAKLRSPRSLEKPLGRARGARTKTDTGGRVEHTEAIGGTMVKELGIIAP